MIYFVGWIYTSSSFPDTMRYRQGEIVQMIDSSFVMTLEALGYGRVREYSGLYVATAPEP